MEAPIEVSAWHAANKDSFSPPVCNKLMHRGQLSVMFVGGPNTREDFHLEHGSELFFMLKGGMRLPTVQKCKRVDVDIPEGALFLLPGRIPHSPQRPEAESLGLVVERKRIPQEYDALRFYVDPETCEEKLFERNFQCEDLGKDLKPVIEAWNSSQEKATRVPGPHSVPEKPAITERTDIEVPMPFLLRQFIDERTEILQTEGSSINPFEGHPDEEFHVRIEGACSTKESLWQKAPSPQIEVLFMQIEGTSEISVKNKESDDITKYQAGPGTFFVVGKDNSFKLSRPPGAIAMRIMQIPRTNFHV